MPVSLELPRRAFLAACGAMVGTGCSPWRVATRLGRIGVTDPHPDAYLPVLDALIATLLPVGDPRLPLDDGALRHRLLTLFPR